MRFNGICLISQDVRRLREFYESALHVEAEGDDVHVKLKTPGAVLSIFSESGMEGMAPGSMKHYGHGGFTIEFEVENTDEEYKRLKSMNVPIVKMPTTQPWGRRSVWFRDPDGNIVNFFQDLSR
ncbi:MAG: VOC family protein [Dehalococcoidia bacterium]